MKTYSAGALAKEAGVSPDSLRHYERKGVLERPSRGANGYRQYSEAALQRVLLVRRALALGFTLDELREVFAVRDRGGTPCEKVRRMAGEKLAGVEQRLKELIVLRDELRSTMKVWDSRLKAARGKRARLLETLPTPKMAQLRPLRLSANGDRELKRKTK